MVRCMLTALAIGAVLAQPARADVPSGPAVGSELPELSVFGVTGDVENEDVDFTAHREGRPTIFCFVSSGNLTRPGASLLRALDDQITTVSDNSAMVVVWLTDDPEATKDYLSGLQQTLQLEHSSLAVYTSDSAGPDAWELNPDALMTAVVAVDGKIAQTFGFDEVNAAAAEDVIASLAGAQPSGDGTQPEPLPDDIVAAWTAFRGRVEVGWTCFDVARIQQFKSELDPPGSLPPLLMPTDLIPSFRIEFGRRWYDLTQLPDAGAPFGLKFEGEGSIDALLEELPRLPSLQRLDLQGTSVTDAGLAALSDFPDLRVLVLHSTQITDAGLAELSRSTSLEYLALNYTQVTDAGMSHLARMTNLKFLDLSDTAVTDAALAELSGLTDLESLYIGFCEITDAGLPQLGAFTNLTALDLTSTRVTDAGMSDVAALTNLTILSVGVTSTTDAGLRELMSLEQLQFLSIGRTQITDAGALKLMDMTSLLILNLDETAVTADALRRLRRALPDCVILPVPDAPGE